MKYYFKRRKSTREVNRLEAVDQHGVQHTLIERISVIHNIGASGRIFGSENGSSSYYSATSGDALLRLPDGSFESQRQNPRLALTLMLQK
jgi:hypothetical protein